METLLLISGELLLVPLVVAAALVAELVMGVLLGAVELVLGPLHRRRARRPGVAIRVPGLSLLRRARAWLVRLCMAVFVLLVAADLLFFEAALRHVLARLEPLAGLQVEFERATGSFVAGRVELHGLLVRRTGDASSVLDLRARRFEIDVAMLEVLAPEKRVQKLTVEGLHGRVERRAAAEGRSAVRRRFRVDSLALVDVHLDVSDHTRARSIELPLQIERFEVAPLRSELALFDLLYAADGNGSVAGIPFEVHREQDEHGRVATWRAPELPLALVMPYLGSAEPYLEGGHVEIEVRGVWRPERVPPEVSMQCRLVLHDLRVVVPEGLSAPDRALALGLRGAVEKLGAEIPLEFELELDEDRSRGAVSLESIGLWQAASGALARQMLSPAWSR